MLITRIPYNNISESLRVNPDIERRINLPKDNPEWLPQVDLAAIEKAYRVTIDKLFGAFPTIVDILDKKDIIVSYSPELFIGQKPTMCTNGQFILIDPYFANWLLDRGGDECFMFVLIHECFHILFDHTKEAKDNYADATLLDQFRINWAQDYEINYFIENFMWLSRTKKLFSDGITEKCKGLYDEYYGKKSMGWNDIYQDILKKRRKTSDEWKASFKKGFDEVLAELRREKKIK